MWLYITKKLILRDLFPLLKTSKSERRSDFCWKMKRKNIEFVDDEIVHIVYRKINSLDEGKHIATLQAIITFLPGLLQKRTWGFAQQFKDAIEAIRIL